MMLESFVPVAPDSDFPLENLPWGAWEWLEPGSSAPRVHVGVALGEYCVSATELQAAGFLRDLPGAPPGVFSHGRLNAFMGSGRAAWRAARQQLQRLLGAGEGALRDDPALRQRAIHPASGVRMLMPAEVGDYTDFYASRQHATHVGAMFRGPANALQPNWLHLPVGYHGRSSSIVPSGVDVHRPRGQVLPAAGGTTAPVFGPSAQVDFELEVAAVVGPGNPLGAAIPLAEAWDHVFGLVLLNDWSARDIQKWEYVPLGPFNGKNWATQISPWVVTLEALEPFRAPLPPQAEPEVLPYLREGPYPHRHTYDVELAVDITPAAGPGGVPARAATVTRSNLKNLYWSFAQMVAHHTAGGCNLRPGDLLGSGTISGDTPGSAGCLLELTWGGRDALELQAERQELERDQGGKGAGPAEVGPGGEAIGAGAVEGKGGGGVVLGRRTYLEDGDTVTLRGWCDGEGGTRRVGFGRCEGKLLPCR
ncbi:hypothetical protein HYH02_001386 [Chlamydomonas schloesseri]|uniref:Fumarylacetoacetase n=1 Tax=Chlamydomonas schloesseri TaxID=2026947 RepID=A0A835WUR1_9CHLO|nr:hypothetical protein HYH02_001386 [Chlamydomonas schloesseri]|eukprot:KAG2454362.1 hypothetical protein HYH02_001386 [Chlamydomonas schloesseri]